MEINDEIQEVLGNHKNLVYHLESNSLCGELFDPDGDSYEVKIELGNYPKFFPTVYEVGGRIPRKANRHIYTDTGSCCFTTAAKSQILLKTKIKSLLNFVNEIVIRYFENNSFYEINGFYFGQEYSHGKDGIIEAYKDILQIDDTIQVAKTLIQASNEKPLKIHQNCYCGSGRRLRKCTNGKHLINYRKLFLIDKEVIKLDLKSFEEEIDRFLKSKSDDQS